MQLLHVRPIARQIIAATRRNADSDACATPCAASASPSIQADRFQNTIPLLAGDDQRAACGGVCLSQAACQAQGVRQVAQADAEFLSSFSFDAHSDDGTAARRGPAAR